MSMPIVQSADVGGATPPTTIGVWETFVRSGKPGCRRHYRNRTWSFR